MRTHPTACQATPVLSLVPFVALIPAQGHGHLPHRWSAERRRGGRSGGSRPVDDALQPRERPHGALRWWDRGLTQRGLRRGAAALVAPSRSQPADSPEPPGPTVSSVSGNNPCDIIRPDHLIRLCVFAVFPSRRVAGQYPAAPRRFRPRPYPSRTRTCSCGCPLAGGGRASACTWGQRTANLSNHGT